MSRWTTGEVLATEGLSSENVHMGHSSADSPPLLALELPNNSPTPRSWSEGAPESGSYLLLKVSFSFLLNELSTFLPD